MQPPRRPQKNTTKDENSRRVSAPRDNRLRSDNDILSRKSKSNLAKKSLYYESQKRDADMDRHLMLEHFDRSSKPRTTEQSKARKSNSKQKKKVKRPVEQGITRSRAEQMSSRKQVQKKRKKKPIPAHIKKVPLEKSIKKTMPSTKRKRRTKQNYALYYIFGLIFLSGVFFVLANTVLFNIQNIVVEGETNYSHEEIIAKTGLSYGENLFRTDTEKVKRNILENFIYIEEVDVECKFFSSEVKISVKTAKPFINVLGDNGYWIISERSRIISDEAVPRTDLKIIKGINIPPETVLGTRLDEIDENKYNLVREIIGYIDENGINSVGYIDVSDKFNLSFVVDDRITCELGANEKLKDKIHAAAVTIAEKIEPNETVILLLQNPERVFVKNNADSIPVVEEPIVTEGDGSENSPEDESSETEEDIAENTENSPE